MCFNDYMKKVFIEKEIILEDLNIRGFIDLIISEEDGKVYLYDIKTINNWSYKFKFSKKYKQENSTHQEMQLATYGIAVKREFGRLDGMFLTYYNKDSSIIKEIEVDLDYLVTAKSFWQSKVEEHKKGLPPLQENVSPVKSWECNYCQYKDRCDKDN